MNPASRPRRKRRRIFAEAAEVLRVRLEGVNLAEATALARDEAAHGVAVERAAVHEGRIGRKLRHDARGEVVAEGGRGKRREVEPQAKAQVRDELAARLFVGEETEGAAYGRGVLKHVLRQLELVMRQKAFGILPSEFEERDDARAGLRLKRAADAEETRRRVEDGDGEDGARAESLGKLVRRHDGQAVYRRPLLRGRVVGEGRRLDAARAQAREHMATQPARAVERERVSLIQREAGGGAARGDRKSTRLNSSH